VTAAELMSVSTALASLTDRVVAAAEESARDGRDDVATELYEVERELRSGTRRLERLVRDLQ
jgi:hypothetical protein